MGTARSRPERQCAKCGVLMVEFEDGYHEIPPSGLDTRLTAAGRLVKLGISLVGASCVALCVASPEWDIPCSGSLLHPFDSKMGVVTHIFSLSEIGDQPSPGLGFRPDRAQRAEEDGDEDSGGRGRSYDMWSNIFRPATRVMDGDDEVRIEYSKKAMFRAGGTRPQEDNELRVDYARSDASQSRGLGARSSYPERPRFPDLAGSWQNLNLGIRDGGEAPSLGLGAGSRPIVEDLATARADTGSTAPTRTSDNARETQEARPFEVGDRVKLKKDEEFYQRNRTFVLASGAVAVVTDVDQDGDIRIRNPEGSESPDWSYATAWELAPVGPAATTDEEAASEDDADEDSPFHGKITQAQVSSYRPLDSSNLGYNLLMKQGWKEGSGIGRTEQGLLAPLQAWHHGASRGGIGALPTITTTPAPSNRLPDGWSMHWSWEYNDFIYFNKNSYVLFWSRPFLDDCVFHPGKLYNIESAHATGKCLNVADWSTQKGAGIHIWDNPDAAQTQWRIRAISDQTYTLESVSAVGKYINIDGGLNSNGASIHLWDNPESKHTQWRIREVDLGSDVFTLENVKASGRYLNLRGGGDWNGAHIQIWDNPDSEHSRWRIREAGQEVEPKACKGKTVDGRWDRRDKWGHPGGRPVHTLVVGEVVTGRVTNILSNRVWVDIGAERDASFKALDPSAHGVGDVIGYRRIMMINLNMGRVHLESEAMRNWFEVLDAMRHPERDAPQDQQQETEDGIRTMTLEDEAAPSAGKEFIRLILHKGERTKNMICPRNVTVDEVINKYGGPGPWELKLLSSGVSLFRNTCLGDLRAAEPVALQLELESAD